jgi:hypothetical protein
MIKRFRSDGGHDALIRRFWFCIPTSKFELCRLERWSSRFFGRVWSPNLYQTGEPTMTDEMMSLRTLLEKSGDCAFASPLAP